MVICHCRAVSDGWVRTAVADGAVDVETVIQRCGAGSVCGGCRPTIALLLADLVGPSAA
ncbi:MAG: (2Fe-2S)-binding protein [Actinomycetota bacterium]|jgi:bacterioferritin-associated ferredoxin|nr:(2Fe-2S)-binding protein [Actinomycetota bacterium]